MKDNVCFRLFFHRHAGPVFSHGRGSPRLRFRLRLDHELPGPLLKALLHRFRSAQGSADEIAAILVAMGSGIAFGMGYLAYGAVILLGMALLFALASRLRIFEHRGMAEDRLLRITIPETLEYGGAFDDAFDRYLKKAESCGVKTTAMGSMFRLSYKIQMKDPAEEKEFIDELRSRNGNLEISVLPYAEQTNQL